MNQYVLKSGMFLVDTNYETDIERPENLYYIACKVEDENGVDRGMIIKYVKNNLVDIDVDHIENTKEDYEFLNCQHYQK